MAKISELNDAVLDQQILAFKKKVAAGDDSQKNVLIALMQEKKKRMAAAQATPSPEPVAEVEEAEEEAPAPKAKKGLKGKGKKSIGGAKKGKLGGAKKAGGSKASKAEKPAKPVRASKGKKSKKGKAAPAGDKTAFGTIRKPIMVILFSIITLGIYGIIYNYKTFNELKRYRGIGLSGVLALVLCLVPPISAIGGLVVLFLLPSYVTKLYEEDGQEGKVSILYPILAILLAPILVGPILYILKTQGALNEFWASKGVGEGDDEDEEEEDDEDLDDDEDEEIEEMDDDDDLEVMDDDDDDR